MTNPFQYGSVVVGDAFCNRHSQVRDLQRSVENGEKLFVYSERRMGKTSLVQRDIIDAENGSYVTVDRFLRRWIREMHGGVHQPES